MPVKLCAYYLNAKRRSLYKTSKHAKFNNNARHYFSAARLHLMYDDSRVDAIREKQQYLKNVLTQYQQRVAKLSDGQQRLVALQSLAGQLWRLVDNGWSNRGHGGESGARRPEEGDLLVTGEVEVRLGGAQATMGEVSLLERAEELVGEAQAEQIDDRGGAPIQPNDNCYSDTVVTVKAKETIVIGKDGPQSYPHQVDLSSVGFNRPISETSSPKRSTGMQSVVRHFRNPDGSLTGDSDGASN